MSGYYTNDEQERVVLVGVINQLQNENQVDEFLDELAFLAETAGGLPVKRFVQKVESSNPRTFVGPGKLDEIIKFARDNDINTIIFDDELTATQLRNIEKLAERKILDIQQSLTATALTSEVSAACASIC